MREGEEREWSMKMRGDKFLQSRTCIDQRLGRRSVPKDQQQQ